MNTTATTGGMIKNATATAGNVVGADFIATGDIDLDAAMFSESSFDGADIMLTATNNIENTSVKASDSATVIASQISGSTIQGNVNVQVTGTGGPIVNSDIAAGNNVSVRTDAEIINSTIASGNNVALVVSDLDNVTFTAGGEISALGVIGNVVGTDFIATGDIDLDAAMFSESSFDGNAITLIAINNIENTSVKASDTANVAALQISGSTIQGNIDVKVIATGLIVNSDIAAGTDAFVTTAAEMINSTIAAGNDATLVASGLANVDVTAGGRINATNVTGNVVNGSLIATDDLTLNAVDMVSGTSMDSGAVITINANDELENIIAKAKNNIDLTAAKGITGITATSETGAIAINSAIAESSLLAAGNITFTGDSILNTSATAGGMIKNATVALSPIGGSTITGAIGNVVGVDFIATGDIDLDAAMFSESSFDAAAITLIAANNIENTSMKSTGLITLDGNATADLTNLTVTAGSLDIADANDISALTAVVDGTTNVVAANLIASNITSGDDTALTISDGIQGTYVAAEGNKITTKASTINGGTFTADEVLFDEAVTDANINIGADNQVAVAGAESIEVLNGGRVNMSNTNDENVVANIVANDQIDFVQTGKGNVLANIDGPDIVNLTVDGVIEAEVFATTLNVKAADAELTTYIDILNADIENAITVTEVDDDLAVGVITANDSVDLTANNGNILDNDADGDTVIDITAASITMNAALAIGTDVNKIETSGQALASVATNGDIYQSNSSNQDVTVSSLNATAGSIDFTENGTGDLTFADNSSVVPVVYANDNVIIATDGGVITNDGVIAFYGDATIDAGGDVTANGRFVAEYGNATITAGGDVTTSADVKAKNYVTITADGDVTTSCLVEAAIDVAINAGGDVTTSGSIEAYNSVTIVADGDVTTNSSVYGGNNITIDAGGYVDVTRNGSVEAVSSVTINAGSFVMTNAEVKALNSITIVAGDDVTANAEVKALFGVIRIDAGGYVDVTTNGSVQARNNVTIDADSILVAGGVISENATVALRADNEIEFAGLVQGDDVSMTSENAYISNDDGSGVIAANIVDLSAKDDIAIIGYNEDGSSNGNGIFDNGSGSVTVTANTTGADADVQLGLNAAEAIVTVETAGANADIVIAGNNIVIPTGCLISDEGNIQVKNDGDLTIESGRGINADGEVYIATTGDIIGGEGTNVTSGGATTIMSGGSMGSSTPLTIEAGGLLSIGSLDESSEQSPFFAYIAGHSADNKVHYNGHTPSGPIIWNGSMSGGREDDMILVGRGEGDVWAATQETLIRNGLMNQWYNTYQYFPLEVATRDRGTGSVGIELIDPASNSNIDGLPEGVGPAMIDTTSENESMMWDVLVLPWASSDSLILGDPQASDDSVLLADPQACND
ncbi:MAG: hypothetical protein WCS17_08165 [Prevotella sp.]